MRPLLLSLLLAACTAAEPPALAEARSEIAAARAEQRLVDDWARERADLERLLAARDAALARREAALAPRREAAAAKRDRLARGAADHAALAADEVAAGAAGEAVLAACRAADPSVAGDLPTGSTDALAVVDAALRAVERVRADAARWDVEVAVGRLPDGGETAAQILRGGLAAGWWLALDGRSGGLARRGAGGWSLTRDDDPAAAAAIAAAISQARGDAVPEPVLLPVPVAP